MMSNIFNLFGNKPIRSDRDGKKPYKAFTCSDPDAREALGIAMYHQDDRGVEIVYYRDLIRVVSSAPNELVLFFTDSAYTIKGNNLCSLLFPLRDYKINTLHAFNPQNHPSFADENKAIVIYSIEGQTMDEWWETMDKRLESLKKEQSNLAERLA